VHLDKASFAHLRKLGLGSDCTLKWLKARIVFTLTMSVVATVFFVIVALLAIAGHGAVNPALFLVAVIGVLNGLLLVLIFRGARGSPRATGERRRGWSVLARLRRVPWLNGGSKADLLDEVSFRAMLEKVQAREHGVLMLIDAADPLDRNLDNSAREEALGVIASAIRRAVRSNDLTGYLGDDRFAAFLRGSGHERSNAIAQRISRQVEENVLKAGAGHQVRLSVCIGGVSTNRGAVEEVLRSASEILASAQSRGPGTIALSLD
jgi:diguanylate cyclase (GGDEF)-like protein